MSYHRADPRLRRKPAGCRAVRGQRVFQRHKESIALQRLLQEIDGPAPGGFDGGRDVTVARDHEDRRRILEVLNFVEGLQTVAGLPCHRHIPAGIEKLMQSVPNHRVIRDDNDVNQWESPSSQAQS
jgi:hypothetical protein